jgi:hypothetical protein
MYNLPQSLLVENPIDRYLINSPMLPDLKKNADGSLTLYIQHDSPGKDKEANGCPRRKGRSGWRCASTGRKRRRWVAHGRRRRWKRPTEPM